MYGKKAKQWWKIGVAVTVIGFVHFVSQDDGERDKERNRKADGRKVIQSTKRRVEKHIGRKEISDSVLNVK